MVVKKLKKIMKNGVEYLLDFVDLTSNQTIGGTKTFSTSPVVPSKTSDATNSGTAIATEAQVYKKADSSSLGTAAAKNTGTASGNVPVLDSNGKLATSTLPGVALTDTFTVSTSSDLTSLSSAEQGDIAIATSENKTYVLSQAPYSTAANWKQILSPTGGVTSVNGSTGAVTVSEFTPGGTATTGYVVTKTANGYEWQAPTGGLQVSPNSTITGIKYIWYGTEADYANLSQYYTDVPGDTEFHTF